jgi:hypothetical protein
MKRTLIACSGAFLLAALPFSYAAAQPAPDVEESEGFQNDQPSPETSFKEILMMKHGGGKGVQGGMMNGRPGMRGEHGAAGSVEEETIIAIIKKHNPAFAAKLEELKKIAPAKYRVVLFLAGKALGIARMENEESVAKDAVRTVVLEYETKELAIKYEKAADADKTGLKAALKTKLAELFDMRLKGQELRVKRMEKDLAKLKSNLETRRAGKAKIVEERLGQMTGENPSW